jgi:hypothetical protein
LSAPKDKLEPIATRAFKPNDELYKIVDFLNKNLKQKRLMFGLSKDNNKDTMVITIYEI